MNDYLPDNTDPGFVELIDVYLNTDIEFPHLKSMTLAKWALESGWGLSDLAQKHNNFAGMKWRTGMKPYGFAVSYKDWQGKIDPYVSFHDKAHFIKGYWARLDMIGAYSGWRGHTKTPEAFIGFVGPIWVGMSKTHNDRYVSNVKRLNRTRTRHLKKA